MKRPEVTLENFEEVYRFYEEHEQSQIFARTAHLALSHVYRPKLTCGEGVEETIEDELRSGSRLVVSPNHLTDYDQYVVVSLAEKLKALHPLRGNTFIPAKLPLFTSPGIAGRLKRRAIDGLGGIPAIRMEDLLRQGIEITDEIKETYDQSVIRASETYVSKIVGGSHMAGYFEQTRNRVDYRLVQPLKKGMGYTAIAAASRDVRVMLLPVGVYYGGEPTDYKRPQVPHRHTPDVHVGMPIPVETSDVNQLVELLRPAIQDCVDVAVARAG